jgi:hypothetical protein
VDLQPHPTYSTPNRGSPSDPLCFSFRYSGYVQQERGYIHLESFDSAAGGGVVCYYYVRDHENHLLPGGSKCVRNSKAAQISHTEG